MMKKAWALGLAFAMVLGMTGCGEDNQQGPDNVEQMIEKSDDNIAKLTVWGSAQDQALLINMVENFQEENRGQAEFDIKVEKMEEAAAATAVLADMDKAADVFVFEHLKLDALVAAGALAPVQVPDAVEREVTSYAFNAAVFNNRLYAYPMATSDSYVTFFNKDYINAAEAASVTTALYKAERLGKKFAMDWTDPDMLCCFLGSAELYIRENEAGTGNETNINTIYGVHDGAEISQGMTDIANSPGFAPLTDGEMLEGIRNGEVVGLIGSQNMLEDLKALWGDKLGIARIPTVAFPGGQVDMSAPINYRLVGVNAYSRDADWAHKLASYLTNEENQRLRLQEKGDRPTDSSLANSTEATANPLIKAINQQEKFCYAEETLPGYEAAFSAYALWLYESKFPEYEQLTETGTGTILVKAGARVVDYQENLDNLQVAIENGGVFVPVPVTYPVVELPAGYDTWEEVYEACKPYEETTEEGVITDVQ